MFPKVKVLLAGRVESVEAAVALQRKIQALHEHPQAGPFDVVFGSCSDVAALHQLVFGKEDEPTTTTEAATWSGGPIPFYLQDTTATTTWVNRISATAVTTATTKSEDDDEKEDAEANREKVDDDDDEKEAEDEWLSPCFELAKNLYILRDRQDGSRTDPVAGIWRIPVTAGGASISRQQRQHLVVASVPPQYRTDSVGNHSSSSLSSSSLQYALPHVSYTGCDVLLSTEWPQGMETLLKSVSASASSSIIDNASTTTAAAISFDVADVALKARSRYHVAFDATIFQQSPAFQHVRAITSTSTAADVATHTGRFLALCPVPVVRSSSSTTTKLQKWIHAVGIVPLHSQGAHTNVATEAKALCPCPYTDAVYPWDDPRRGQNHAGSAGTSSAAAVGLSEAAARRILAEDRRQWTHGRMSGTDRWANVKRPRPQTHAEQWVDGENCTLFVYGLHQDVTGRLQQSSGGGGPQPPHGGGGDVLLLQAFAKYGAVKVRKPPGGAHTTTTRSFCFLEFPTHEKAAACLEATDGTMTVAGVPLTLKWATPPATTTTTNGTAADHKRQRLSENEARDSSTIYFKFTTVTKGGDGSSPPPLPSLTEAGEELRKWTERTLELALADNGGGGADDNEGDMVRAADEPALQVQVRLVEQRSFGFLDFASHAAASMVLATLTGTTDGGRILAEHMVRHAQENIATGEASLTESTSSTPPPSVIGPHVGIYLNWAQARIESGDRNERDVIEDGTSGFRFSRNHFPADARQDCWFCLASESCEKHLITGVYDTCYAAMPKGPLHPGHVLIIPVQHSSQGALKDPVVAREMEMLKTKLRHHASAVYDSDLFVFERAIQTKGGYHTHVHCIPVERKLGLKLQSTMLAQARKLGLELREINSDIGLQAVLASDEDDDTNQGGYFYAEIPLVGTDFKRFLYKVDTGGGGRAVTVPLQFGREVVAAVLENPKLAHWKSCVVDEEQEKAIAASFQESFAKVNVVGGN